MPLNQIHENWLGKIMTVRGLVGKEEMGFTSPHEHLLATHQGPKVDTTDPVEALEEMQKFYRYGGRTVVDMTTSEGLGRKPELIRQIAEKSSVNIIMGTGFYKDAWLTPEVREMSEDQYYQVMVDEINLGVKESGVHAGVIGEIGVSRTITSAEERVLAASARAQRATGAAINIHFDIGTTEPEYHHAVDILEGEGADLNRVVLDHFVCRPDEVELCQPLVKRGCYIEFDLFGMEVWQKIFDLTRNTRPEVQVASIKWFISAGMIERILLAQDVGNQIQLPSHGGFGYTHLLRHVIPELKEYGVTDEEIKTITEENAKRLFPFQ